MDAELERIEVKTAGPGDDDLAVEHAAGGELLEEWFEEFGEVASERLLVAALDQQLIMIAEDERAKAVPLGLEDPGIAFGDIVDPFGEHGKDRRWNGKMHAPMVYLTRWLSRCTQMPENALPRPNTALNSRNLPGCCTQIPDRNRCK